LEEEFEEFRQKIELEQALKEEELAELRGLLKTVEQQNKHAGNTEQLCVQIQCSVRLINLPCHRTQRLESPHHVGSVHVKKV
jgi:hypothetical protein